MTRFKTCCKINLGLLVTAKRPDGYHNLQTVFYPIPLSDELSIEEAEEDRLYMSGIALDGDPHDNLVMRAIRILREKGYTIPPLHISLHKNIPSGAGLGGGSSDAAATLVQLNSLYRLGMGQQEMERTVAPLGADCPFFVRCQPVYAEGIGDVFTPISLTLKGMYIVLVKPNESVSTREAYAHVHPQMPQVSLIERISKPVETWRECVTNDFEQSVFSTHPIIRQVKEQLYSAGAVYASMSGSGSTVFGLFRKDPELLTRGMFSGMFLYKTRL